MGFDAVFRTVYKNWGNFRFWAQVRMCKFIRDLIAGQIGICQVALQDMELLTAH